MPPLPEEEVIQPAPVEEKPEVQEEVKPEVPEETAQQVNFKALRMEKERLERENADAMRRLAEYEKQQTAPKEQEEDLEINIGDDDLFEGKHYRKLQKQLQRQQDDLRKYQEQNRATATESRLRSKYSDFDKVLSSENVKRLMDSEPEIAVSISSTKDLYNKAVAAYKMIKKFGIYVEDNYESDRNIAKQNSMKPKPLASVSPQQGDSPLSKANAFADGRLTPELKRQLRKEMEEASQGY